MCVRTVRGGLQSKLYTSQQWRRQGEGGRGNVPPKPGKFAKDGKQFAPQPAVSLESNKILKFLLILKKILLNFFSKTFKFFFKNFQNFQ